MNKKLLLQLNLTGVFVTAFALTTLLHEFAHALMGKFLHVSPVLFHSYVSYDNSTTPAMHQAAIAASGPIFSLVQTLLFFMLFRSRKTKNFASLLFFWMALIGMIVFLGYVMMGPFIPYGDTGKVYRFLSIPTFISIPVAVISLGTMIYIMRQVPAILATYLFALDQPFKIGFQKTLYHFFVIPILAGTLVNVLLSLPAPTGMSLAFPLIVSLLLIPVSIRLQITTWTNPEIFPLPDTFSKQIYWPIFTAAILLCLSRILVTGIPI